MIKNNFDLLKPLLIVLQSSSIRILNRQISNRNNWQKNLSLRVQKMDNLFI